jgi:hypothetical protein
MAGVSHGTAFVVMETKDGAQEAIRNLDKLIFANHLIKVELSKPPSHKVTATIRTGDGATTPSEAGSSPAPSESNSSSNPSRAEIAARSIAVLNVPDTMNDARLRSALASAAGVDRDVVKLVLHPTHGGAVLEFANATAAGKAALAIDGVEVDAGGAVGRRKLRIGTVAELFKAKAEKRVDRIDKPGPPGPGPAGTDDKKAEGAKTGASAAELMPPPPLLIKRPGVGARTGPKKLPGFVRRSDEAATAVNGAGADGKGKSNADFKKMFLGGASNAPDASVAAPDHDGDGKNQQDGNRSTTD